MKKIEKLILMSSALLMSAGAWADDFGDFGDFGGFDDETSGSSENAIEVSGNVSTDIRAYVDANDGESNDKIEVEAEPSGNLELAYSGNNSDLILSLCMDANKIQNNPEDIIDELVLRGRLGDYVTVEAGKMKIVWGKGDKLHVLDNFNADDYSDFIIPDYLDRRVSTPMLRGIISLPVANLNIEGVYTPLLPVDQFATSGRWEPAQVASLTNTITTVAKQNVAAAFSRYTTATGTTTLAGLAYQTAGETYQKAAAAYQANPTDTTMAAAFLAAKTAFETAQASYESAKLELTNAGTAYMLCLENANALSADPTVIYPDLQTLKYGQFGGRATWTLGQIDMGLSYYNGWYKQPSVNGEKMLPFMNKYLAGEAISEEDKFLAYDKKQTFGLEASTILWHFNFRGEFAYNLTEDTDGTNPWIHNNSIGWLGGFDIDLPFWNANLNVQEIGTFVMKGDECDNNKANNIYSTDVDYCVNGYTNNKIAVNLTASFMNDKITPEVTVMYGFENKDFVVMPKVSYKADQNLTFTASGMFINCGDDNSEFKAWEKNSFVSLGAQYQF